MKDKYSKGFYLFMKAIGGWVLKLMCRPKYTNKNNLPKEGRYILAANHVSGVDPILVALGQKRPIRFMAKKELFENKFVKFLFSRLGTFAIDRSSKNDEALEFSRNIIAKGDALGIFIEGTRSKTNELLRPRSGAVMLAHQTNSKIIPVSVTYRDTKKKAFTKMYITYGDPVTVEELGIKEGTPHEYRDASRNLMARIRVTWEKDKYGN